MELGLQGKVVAITGGTSGIGKAAALAFLREGCRVAVCGRSTAKLAAVSQGLAPGAFLAHCADVGDIEAIRAFAQTVVNTFGCIDVWINNAGISETIPILEMPEQAFNRMVDVNLKAVFFGGAAAASHMKTSGGGVIINTSSFTSVVPTAGKALYGATKAAINSLTASMAGEWAADNIRVVSVIPGYIRTEMTQKNIAENSGWLTAAIADNRLGEPQDLADVYVFLASRAADYITGVSFPVAGGKLCVQNPMWSWERKAKDA